jgi:hypothetical protein
MVYQLIARKNSFLTQTTHPNSNQRMKTKITKSNIILIFVAAATALFVAGCAEMGASNTTSLLSAAGFRARTPQTPKQQEIYAALPPYKVERATVKGKTFYVFKDEKAGVAYVGHEPEYQRYQQLAIQQQIAQDYYMAATMPPMYARGWYGAWGPTIWW